MKKKGRPVGRNLKTHCVRGHKLSKVGKRGRHCAACRRAKDRKRYGIVGYGEEPVLGTPCMICGKGTKENLCADHDHDSGMFRGWLCHKCNRGLGCFEDSLKGIMKVVYYLCQIKQNCI